jgi:exocyst complex component 7
MHNSRLYDDVGLQNIFMMNNLYYAVQKVMDSPPLRELLGDDWLRRQRGQIRKYEAGYLRASWIAVLSGLRDDGGVASAAAHRTVRDQARSFNAAFEEMYRTQMAWKVSDPQLRIAVSERLIPAYRSFLGRASRLSVMKHVKYSLEDLENYVLDFFEGAQKFVR